MKFDLIPTNTISLAKQKIVWVCLSLNAPLDLVVFIQVSCKNSLNVTDKTIFTAEKEIWNFFALMFQNSDILVTLSSSNVSITAQRCRHQGTKYQLIYLF